MITRVAFILFGVLKYLLIIEFLIALFIIIEGVFNVRVGLRSGYIKTILWLLQYGKRRLDSKLSAVELFQRPEKTWSQLQARADLLEDDAATKPLQVEVEEMEPSQFKLSSTFTLLRSGLRAIVEDDVTKAFDAEELPYWNLLTRTNKGYQYISFRLSVLWGLGFLFRHFLLFPVRLIVCIFGLLFLIITATICSKLRDGKIKSRLVTYSSLVSFRILARALTLHCTYHDRQNKAKKDGICVANHTSPIDAVVMSCDNVYSFVGQQHGGPFGFLQNVLAKAFDHIYFERSEAKDRSLVSRRMHEHILDPSKPPILIFPEGACVNNTSVMMFKKGSFEVDALVYPVAIRYNPIFGDAFWGNQPTMQDHIWDMMTSWAIVCDVWYLPPTRKMPDEDATQFANRVRMEIAKKGGLVDIDWDPRFFPESKRPSESRWRKEQQKALGDRISGKQRNEPSSD
ncbi:glycerol-3-phosphate acyltransferase 4-like [Paramacrobiotus metropolitanus]|uniref:glycerol-3-phosphate acyltransferase 4-like n=1 Tax=Paramacrobiotus metropolitanus TaxID=2943436 RepID=UPI002445BDD9|nr:glycerol-3-phosphate acyltransferase 4-like [Paramacrobiotus metropolitanus]